MAFLEDSLVALFILWSLLSICYAIRIPRLHRVLVRINWFEAWVRWGLFNSSDPAVRPGFFEVEYRDRDSTGKMSPWITGMKGHCWSWRAALWNPERRLVDSIHHLGKTIKSCVEAGTPAREALEAHAAVVERHLRKLAPTPAGAKRDIRIVRRVHSLGERGGELVFAFTTSVHAPGR